LKNMQQRMDQIGGRCELRTVPGASTEVKFLISVPVSARCN